MKTIEQINRMSTFSKMMKKEGKSIAFVPTMGCLHDGHLSLIKTAKKHADIVVVSIFVNFRQFGENEDFEKYPRDLKRDEELARTAGADVIFAPSAQKMYPEGYSTTVHVEGLTEVLCGASRPGHFDGVTTVVCKLFGIIKPDIAYFGQKDAQQSVVIKKMVEDLNIDTEIKVLPIIREGTGLAMSSRNSYLTEDERHDAAIIYKSLTHAGSIIRGGERDTKKIISAIQELISSKKNMKVDYIAIVNPKTLQALDSIEEECLIAVAVYLGASRLIDNIVVNQPPNQ